MQEGFYNPCMHVLREMPFHDVAYLVGDAIFEHIHRLVTVHEDGVTVCILASAQCSVYFLW